MTVDPTRAPFHTGVCIGCTEITRLPIIAALIDADSGPPHARYACPDCAPYLVHPDRLEQLVDDHISVCAACHRDGPCAWARTLYAVRRAALEHRARQAQQEQRRRLAAMALGSVAIIAAAVVAGLLAAVTVAPDGTEGVVWLSTATGLAGLAAPRARRTLHSYRRLRTASARTA